LFQIFYTYLLASLCAPVSYACNKLMLQYQPQPTEAVPFFLGKFLNLLFVNLYFYQYVLVFTTTEAPTIPVVLQNIEV
jgi:hypothetical protein